MRLKSQFLRIVVASFFFLCTVEAFFWPIVMKPGTHLEWWQIHFSAKIGYVIGFPALTAHFYLNVLGMNLLGPDAIIISFFWAVIIYFLLTKFAMRHACIRKINLFFNTNE